MPSQSASDSIVPSFLYYTFYFKEGFFIITIGLGSSNYFTSSLDSSGVVGLAIEIFVGWVVDLRLISADFLGAGGKGLAVN